MPWHCPPLTLAGHAYQAPREWIYDARGAFAALIKAGDAETAELFLGSVRSQVEGLKGAPDPRTAALAVDFQAWMLAELDLIAPLSRPGAAQEPGEPPPEPEPPPAAAARPGPPQEPDEAALGEPVDYPDDPLPEPPDFSDLERDTASLRAGSRPPTSSRAAATRWPSSWPPTRPWPPTRAGTPSPSGGCGKSRPTSGGAGRPTRIAATTTRYTPGWSRPRRS
jgi:hypothetical protein